jgi:hypothetical protein
MTCQVHESCTTCGESGPIGFTCACDDVRIENDVVFAAHEATAPKTNGHPITLDPIKVGETTSGEAVVATHAGPAGKLPSERCAEIAGELARAAVGRGEFRDWGNPNEGDKEQALMMTLDERLGRG